MYFAEGLTWEICIVGLSLTVFTLINLLTKPYKHKSDLLLCLWLLLLNIPLLQTALSHQGIDSPAFNLYTNPMLTLLHGPILYWYVRILVSSEDAKILKSDLLHLIPFVLFYLLYISMDHPHSMRPSIGSPDIAIGSAGEGEVMSLFRPLMVHFGLINGLVFVVYSIVTIYALVQHQKTITEIFSQNDNEISLKWLYTLPATFAALVLLNFMNENVLESASVIDPLTFHMMSFLSFIILLCFFGVKQKPVFFLRKPSSENKIESETPIENSDVNDNDLSDEAIARVIEDMQAYMRRGKPFINPDFSVYGLAEELNIPRRNLSQVLNSRLSKNFYQYVNEFRIDEVKALLQDPNHAKSTILDIAFRCGFKSKSSFNSLFKQYCDVTPSQYRKKVRQG